jgi:DNA-binding HxlR family transcriptional regulator
MTGRRMPARRSLRPFRHLPARFATADRQTVSPRGSLASAWFVGRRRCVDDVGRIGREVLADSLDRVGGANEFGWWADLRPPGGVSPVTPPRWSATESRMGLSSTGAARRASVNGYHPRERIRKLGHDIMPQYHAESSIRDISYLARSEHRVPTLVALTERPRSRAELCELTGVSSSTIRRTLDEFEDRTWIERDGYRYTATGLGEVVATGIEALVERVETERKLRTVWEQLPAAIDAFSVETWAAMTLGRRPRRSVPAAELDDLRERVEATSPSWTR